MNTSVQALTTFAATSAETVFVPLSTPAVMAASTQMSEYVKTSCGWHPGAVGAAALIDGGADLAARLCRTFQLVGSAAAL